QVARRGRSQRATGVPCARVCVPRARRGAQTRAWVTRAGAPGSFAGNLERPAARAVPRVSTSAPGERRGEAVAIGRPGPLLFVTGEYPPDVGGVADYTCRLREALCDLDWPSQVLTRRHVRRWDARALVGLLRAAPRRGFVHLQFQAAAFDLLGDVCLMPTLLHRLRP